MLKYVKFKLINNTTIKGHTLCTECGTRGYFTAPKQHVEGVTLEDNLFFCKPCIDKEKKMKNEFIAEDTPRTNEVFKNRSKLPYGSMVVAPEGHPPSDPWALARELERELNELNKQQKAIDEANAKFDELVRFGEGRN